MKRFFKYIIYTLLFVVGQQTLWSQENALTGSAIDDDVVLELEDIVEWNDQNTTAAQAMVQLKLYDDLTLYSSNWSLQVNYKYYYVVDGVNVLSEESEQLTISYDPAAGTTYVDRASKFYDLSALNVDGGKSKLQVVSYSFPEGSLTSIPGGVSLELSHHFDRYYKFETTNVPDLTAVNPEEFGFTNTQNPKYLELSWTQVDAALTYDLEWLFVEFEECNNGDLSEMNCPELTDMAVNYRNATRIETQDNHYRIPMAYGRGYLLYRVRGVGKNYRGIRTEGNWSTHLTALSAGTVGDANKVVAYKGFERNKNWSYSESFIEEGKHKEVVSFFDGSQRNRQTVTILNEEDHAVVAETQYDFQGRAALQVMPYPTENKGLQHYENQNFAEGSGDVYSRKHFDQDQHVSKEFFPGSGYVFGGAEKMSPSIGHGASNYFSKEGTHPVEGVNQEYVASAEAYPYARTVYSNDGLNRVLRVGGIGDAHELSTGRGTEMVYTTINESAELDRLFGNEAGENGYLKNYTEDANGEISVSYYDLSGRLIASGVMLNQNDHPNLKTLDYKPDAAVLVNNLATGEEFVDGMLIGTSDIFSAHPMLPTLFEFEYKLSETTYTVLCGNDILFQDECRYDLEIHLYDEDWAPMEIAIKQYDESNNELPDLVVSHIWASNIGTDYTYDFTLELEPGLYHIKKILRLHEDAIPGYLSTYNTNLDNSVDCAPGTLAYPEKDCDCNNVIEDEGKEDLTTCELKKLLLLEDMGPGGQYFDNTPIADPALFDPNAWLEAMDARILAYNTANATSIPSILANLNTYTGYSFANWDEVKCAIDQMTALANGSETVDCGTGVSNYSFPENWVEVCMLPYHPEYFQYLYQCGQINLASTGIGNGSSTSATPLYKSVDVIDYRTRSYEAANLTEEEQKLRGYFDPLNLVDNSVSPSVSNGTYDLPSGITWFTVADTEIGYDPTQPGKDGMPGNFDINEYNANAAGIFVDGGVAATGEYPVNSPFDDLYDHLTRFVINEDLDGFYTIWDVLAYQDGVGKVFIDIGPDFTAITVPDHLQAFLSMLYDTDNGLLSPNNPNHISRFEYFFGRYSFFREYLLYQKSKELEGEFRALYSQVYADITDGSSDFRDRFSLGLTALDWDYYFAPEDILYTNQNTSTDVCFECGTYYDFEVRYPKNEILESYTFVNTQWNTLYDNVENTSITVTSADVANTMGAIEDSYLTSSGQNADLIPMATTTLSTDPDCGQDCIFKAEIWITSFEDCALSESGLDALKDQLITFCETSCDGVSPGASSWTYNDVNNVSVSAEIPVGSPTEITVTITQNGSPLCSESFTFMTSDEDQYNCGCENLNEYITIKGYTGDYTSEMTADLIAAGFISETSDYSGEWLNYCTNNAASGTLSGLLSSGGIFPSQWLDCNYMYIPTPCEIQQTACEYAWELEKNSIDEYNASLKAESDLQFEAEYRTYCQDNVNESFTAKSSLDEYSYTLYYYDQAGNLVKTVPPAGVDVLPQTGGAANVNAVVDHRNNPFKTASHPDHRMVTRYAYNSLNELREQDTPDGGLTKFWYDRLGRIQLSQNAKQAGLTPVRYSYMEYDAQGRVIETGEKEAPTGSNFTLDPELMDQQLIAAKVIKLIAQYNGSITDEQLEQIKPHINDAFSVTELNSILGGAGIPVTIGASSSIDDELKHMTFDQWLNPESLNDPGNEVPLTRYEVVHTHYNEYAASDIADISYYNSNDIKYDERNHIHNRVASVSFTEESTTGVIDIDSDYNNALHYSYDVHGNVKSMLQEYHAIGMYRHFKKTEYTYDLVSGNVLEVAYQKGQVDQFFHRYHYDADNRITAAETSQDGVNWERDAAYTYYAHGPLARTELGDKQVQGIDYVYNIHGWLKGVNGTRKEASLDVGQDGYAHPLNGNRYTAKDAFGYSLNYYEGDYKSQEEDFLMTFAGNDLGAYADYKNLYNGNIGQMVSHIADLDVQAGQYTYDQNNRIKEMRVFKPGESASGVQDLLAAQPFAGQSAISAYQTSYTYDLNGNLTQLTRNNDLGNPMDNFNYRYDGATDANGENLPVANNRLLYVNDSVAASVDTDDMNDQMAGNYEYDEIGQLIKDTEAEIAEIKWTLQNKVKEIIYNATSNKSHLAFEYDPMGNRILKIEKVRDGAGDLLPQTDWKYTYYTHDTNGELMAVYDQQFEEEVANASYFLTTNETSHPIYGRERLGMQKRTATDQFSFNANILYDEVTNGILIPQNSSSYNPIETLISTNFERKIGMRTYELKNHLGNVLVTVSDHKVANGTSGVVEDYIADVLSYSDYYPFGMQMPGRHQTSESYRFGFQGQEIDGEIKGEGNSVNYKYRMHDPRLGRFFAVDPLAAKYPYYSQYAFSGNRVIDAYELEGLEPVIDKDGKISGYRVQAGQGPTQIAKDLTVNYGLEIHWTQIVGDNYSTFVKNSNVKDFGDKYDEGYKTMNINTGNVLRIIDYSVPPVEAQPHEVYEGAGAFEYVDELFSGAEHYAKSLKHGGGYFVYSKAKYGKGLYWKPNARGLHNLKGGSVNVNKFFKFGGPIVGAAFEVPEIMDGYDQSTFEGNKQVAGAVGSVGGGWVGGAGTGALLGFAGFETGPGVIITVIAGAIVGGYYGEKEMEELYESIFNDE